MAIGVTSRERVKRAMERAFNGTWPIREQDTTATEEGTTRSPARIEADLTDMVEAIVRGVAAGVANVDADTKQVELVFGLKLKAGLTDTFAMLANLDRQTNVRVKVTFQHREGLARTAETLPAAEGNGSRPSSGKGRNGEASSGTAEDTSGAS